MHEIDPKYLRRPAQSYHREIVSQSRPTGSRRDLATPRRNLRPVREAGRSSSNPDFEAAPASAIVPDKVVFHQKFGQGKVISVEGSGAGRKATIDFKAKGKRVLLLKYARLQIVEKE